MSNYEIVVTAVIDGETVTDRTVIEAESEAAAREKVPGIFETFGGTVVWEIVSATEVHTSYPDVED